MKESIVILIVVSAVAVGAGAYYYLGAPSTQTNGSTESQSTITGLDAAKSMYAYVETQRRSDGFYNYSTGCGDQCLFEATYGYTNTWPVFAATALYRATGDESFLNDARRDADAMLAFCSRNETACEDAAYQMYGLYQETGDGRYRDFADGASGLLLQGPPGSLVPMMMSVESIELSRTYQSTGNITYLLGAFGRLSGAQSFGLYSTIVYQNGSSSYRSMGCWADLAKITMFNSTRGTELENRTLVGDVEASVASSDVPDNVARIQIMSEIQPCIEVYLDLYDVTGNRTYLDGAASMSQYVLSKMWDSPKSPMYSGDGAVLMVSGDRTKTVTDSSYMAYLLSRMKDQKFEVGR